MKKKNFLIIALIVGLIAAYFVWDNFLRTAPSMKRLDAEFKVNAIAFYTEFEQDENGANAKYLNKVVEVNGLVSDIEFPENSKPIISLKTDGFSPIRCTMETDLDQDQLGLRLNSEVTLKGEYIGVLLMEIQLNRSIIIKP